MIRTRVNSGLATFGTMRLVQSCGECAMIRIFRRPGHGRPALWPLLVACALLCEGAWSMGQTLTLNQLQRLLKVVDARGSRTTLPREVTSILDLQPNQYTPDIKQAVYLDDEGNRHGFAPLSDHSGYFMFRSGPSLGNSVYRVDPALHLVKAGRSMSRNSPVIALPEAEAQKELDDEFGRWSKVLSPNGPVEMPSPSGRSPAQPPPQTR